ncbi:hypothetical protein BGZ63DRAFT_367878 [Mariannaea sp. PMI_226]|nr:hypothetical protein BGZ63DRAFT_367878 [Mariannaea sp. PMI_226]
MATPTPIVVCGRSEVIGGAVIEGLKPDYEVVHFIISPEAGVEELPQVLQGKLPDSRASSIGSGNLSNRVKAVVFGGAYDDDMISSIREAASKVAKVAWVKQDKTKATPPLGPEYGKAMVSRVRASLEELQASGKLDDSEGGMFWY